jgi:phosphatidylserine decarboxylase
MAVDKAYSRNRRVVTIIDTDVSGGSGCGKVAMIEVAALMIGDIVQYYSERGYEKPSPLMNGMFLIKGQPKSLFRPGSSIDILVFEKGRMQFDSDLVENSLKTGIQTRFMKSFERPVVETEIKVRSSIGKALR